MPAEGEERTVRSTSQLERFFRQARTLFTGGPVSAVTADLALAEMCFEHNVRWVCNYRTLTRSSCQIRRANENGCYKYKTNSLWLMAKRLARAQIV
jgi:hypothetical protein